MENSDKIYMWLIIIAFVGFLTATAFAALRLNEYKTPIEPSLYKKNIFE